MCNVIDPGDQCLDEGFGVIFDFLDGHSTSVEQIEPKPQEMAQRSVMHLLSQMCFLGLKTKETTHFKSLASQKTSGCPVNRITLRG